MTVSNEKVITIKIQPQINPVNYTTRRKKWEVRADLLTDRTRTHTGEHRGLYHCVQYMAVINRSSVGLKNDSEVSKRPTAIRQ